MGQDPSLIRAEIDETRQRVGDEVDALSYKTDVGARVGDYVDDKKEAVKSTLTGAKDAVTGAVPDGRSVQRARSTAEGNPIGLALGGLALGFIVGTVLPSTRAENQRMGEMSDRLMDAAKDTASEAIDRGKKVAQDAAGAAVDTAKQSGQEQTDELSSTLQDRAQSQSPTGAL
jgi:hypothetical protein